MPGSSIGRLQALGMPNVETRTVLMEVEVRRYIGASPCLFLGLVRYGTSGVHSQNGYHYRIGRTKVHREGITVYHELKEEAFRVRDEESGQRPDA